MILRDGRRFELEAPRRPRHWCSRLMDLAPYGTDFGGCGFELERDGMVQVVRAVREEEGC